MAFQFIPGAAPVVQTIQTSAAVAKTVVGEQNYKDGRKALTTTNGFMVGFLPINPLFIPIQIGLFVVIILVLVFALGMDGGKSALLAYLIQGLIVAQLGEKLYDKIFAYGFGV